VRAVGCISPGKLPALCLGIEEVGELGWDWVAGAQEWQEQPRLHTKFGAMVGCLNSIGGEGETSFSILSGPLYFKDRTGAIA
jgi:hypothetical protein